MKKFFLALTAAFVFAGCATTDGGASDSTDTTNKPAETDASSSDYRDFGVAVDRLESLCEMVIFNDGDLQTGEVSIDKWKENMTSAANAVITSSSGTKAQCQENYDNFLEEYNEFEKKYSEMEEPSDEDKADMDVYNYNLNDYKNKITDVEAITGRCEKILSLIDKDDLTADDVLDKGGEIYYELDDLHDLCLWY